MSSKHLHWFQEPSSGSRSDTSTPFTRRESSRRSMLKQAACSPGKQHLKWKKRQKRCSSIRDSCILEKMVTRRGLSHKRMLDEAFSGCIVRVKPLVNQRKHQKKKIRLPNDPISKCIWLVYILSWMFCTVNEPSSCVGFLLPCLM